MRLDLTKELRLMREDLRQAVSQSQLNNDTIKDAMKNQPAIAAGQTAANSTAPATATTEKVPLFGSSAPKAEEEKKETPVHDLLDEELSKAALEEIESAVDTFIAGFSA